MLIWLNCASLEISPASWQNNTFSSSDEHWITFFVQSLFWALTRSYFMRFQNCPLAIWEHAGFNGTATSTVAGLKSCLFCQVLWTDLNRSPKHNLSAFLLVPIHGSPTVSCTQPRTSALDTPVTNSQHFSRSWLTLHITNLYSQVFLQLPWA